MKQHKASECDLWPMCLCDDGECAADKAWHLASRRTRLRAGGIGALLAVLAFLGVFVAVVRCAA